MRIGTRHIGPGAACFVIAEAGVNHNGNVDRALELVRIAAAAGADAVKFQTFDPGALVASDAPKAEYQTRQTGAGTQLSMLERLHLDLDAHVALAAEATRLGVLFASTPFDHASADLLDRLDVPFMKIGSGDVTNLLLLRHVARFGRPILMSTGMATLAEVSRAVAELQAAGVEHLGLLHCVSQYPAAPEDSNLKAMTTLGEHFGLPIGMSDHTVGLEIAVAAVALGACILEKHLTLDRTLPGPDHAASLSPDEFAALVAQVRRVESARGDGTKEPRPAEMELRTVARRALYARVDIPAGTALSVDDLHCLRPAVGIPADAVDEVVGRRTNTALRRGQRLEWDHLS
jgi:N,N'-diacetyllegionaminate synthase